MITEETGRLGVLVDREHDVMLNGVGGSTLAYSVEVRLLDLGIVVARRVEVGLFDGHAPVGSDVQLDQRVSLNSEECCGKDVARLWHGIAYRQRFILEDDIAIRLDARVAGVPVRMQIDSAATTTPDRDSAALGGVAPDMMKADRSAGMHGIDGNPLTARIHRVASLEVGDETIGPVWLAAADIQSNALFGADVLHASPVRVSYPHELLWKQPGGRFRVDPARAPHV